MTTKAFNGDEVLLERVKELVRDHGINLIVETGTFQGETTLELAKIAKTYTIELNPQYAIAAQKKFSGTGIVLGVGNSPDHLAAILSVQVNRKVLIFLDAHWNAYCPLIDELKAIAAAGIQPVILIHDFFVPGKSTTPGAAWGFDIYNDQPYDWDWVKPHVEAIYPGGFIKTYNNWYEAFRGCLILEPKL